ncbi:MAG: tetratricopeptide repeat protein [Bacteroidetes bacterium]|nr:tetratricopeptide repeat protein [Bacteroidota bacterium]MBU1720511.1 tetratricopeptide repeat protein [Bacteroidota bacterium]
MQTIAKAYNYLQKILIIDFNGLIVRRLHSSRFLWFALLVLIISPHLAICETCQNGNGSLASNARTSYDTADNYYANGDFDNALQYFHQSLDCYQKLSDSIQIGELLNRIAIIQREQGNYAEALEKFQSALDIQESMGNEEGVAQTSNSIGILYMAWNDYPKALSYFHQALKIFSGTGNEVKRADVLNNIGLVYRYTEKYDSALVCFGHSLQIRQKEGDEIKIATSLHNMGVVFNAIAEYEKALDYFNQAMEIREKLNARHEIAVSLNAIGNTYMNLQQYSDADTCFVAGLSIALSLKLTKMIITVYENMVLNYAAMEDHENFRKHFDLYIGFYDSVFNAEKHRQLLDLQTKYETEKSAQKISALEQQNIIHELEIRNNRLILVILFVFLVVVGVSGFLLYRISNMRSQQKVLSAREHTLRLQMNPHFIFNSLVAIQSYIYEKDAVKASSYLSGFAKLIRLILDNSREEYISLDQEIKTLNYYLEIQELRFENKFEYSVHIDPELDTTNIAIPPMLAQPFIENALEHGLFHKNNKGIIDINFSRENHILVLSIEDNGIGRKNAAKIGKEGSSDHESLATKITKERFAGMKKKVWQNISFEIIDLEDEKLNPIGTKVVFKLPLMYLK